MNFSLKNTLVKPLIFFISFAIVFLFSGGTLLDDPVSFEGRINIGKINLPGTFEYNSSDNTYKITGSGENIWFNEDAFFFVYRKVEGDLELTADIEWVTERKHEHRKGGWMIRAGLEADDPYVDFMSHGDSLISLQYRRTKGDSTIQIQSPVGAPATMLLEKHGDQYNLSLTKNGKFYPIGTISVELKGELYAGLAICSHDSTDSQTAVFSNVGFNEMENIPYEQRVVESTLEIIDIETGVRNIVRRAKEHFEAPNWSRDGKTFYYNKEGKIYSLPVNGGTPKLLNTGFADKCNNDHGLSPDGNKLVISHHGEDGKSRIYILPSEGEPKLITKPGPSYWHGWSADGKTLAYCAEREGEYDIYTISVDGGEEKRLTTAKGLDDGPDYSPDGKYIYFNSVRTGQMKIWRMKTDGSEQTQVTPNDEYGDWFPHPSPDGKWIVFLSYNKSVEGHPPNKDVVLRIMPASGGEPDYRQAGPKIIAELFGGQGTINVPSWSPDSKKVAFVSYRLVAP
jgi:TolB protein